LNITHLGKLSFKFPPLSGPGHFLDELGKEFKFSPARPHGLDTVDSIKAMHDGRIKVFIGNTRH